MSLGELGQGGVVALVECPQRCRSPTALTVWEAIAVRGASCSESAIGQICKDWQALNLPPGRCIGCLVQLLGLHASKRNHRGWPRYW